MLAQVIFRAGEVGRVAVVAGTLSIANEGRGRDESIFVLCVSVHALADAVWRKVM